MKKLTLIVLVVLFTNFVFAQNYPEWKATIKVLDETGKALENADVSISFYVTPTNGESEASAKVAGQTDADGIFSASGRCNSVDLGFTAEKAGYYTTTKGYELGAPYQYNPVKWSPHIILVLKKIGHPIPMYVKSITYIKFPLLNKPIGYDLMIGDWVAPYGKGIDTDILFEKEYYENAPNDYYSKITVSFPNKDDGIQLFTVPEEEEGSDLRSPHEAPLDGYQSELTREISARPGQPDKFEYDENRIYLFRVTLSDGQHYGKIYGDFMQFKYYLNPAPNSRNLEFDTKHNLLKLKSRELKVTAP